MVGQAASSYSLLRGNWHTCARLWLWCFQRRQGRVRQLKEPIFSASNPGAEIGSFVAANPVPQGEVEGGPGTKMEGGLMVKPKLRGQQGGRIGLSKKRRGGRGLPLAGRGRGTWLICGCRQLLEIKVRLRHWYGSRLATKPIISAKLSYHSHKNPRPRV